MEKLLTEKIANPRSNFGPGAAAVVTAVVELIQSEGGGLGGEQAQDATQAISNQKQGKKIGGSDHREDELSRQSRIHMDTRRLTVQGLPRGQANESDLRKIFSAAGVVESAAVRITKSKQPTGTVIMSSREEAEAAVSIFDGADMAGRVLRVRLS